MKYIFLIMALFIAFVRGQNKPDSRLSLQINSIELQINKRPADINNYKEYFDLNFRYLKSVEHLYSFYPKFEKMLDQMEKSVPKAKADSVYNMQIRICSDYIKTFFIVFNNEIKELYAKKKQNAISQIHKMQREKIDLIQEKIYVICNKINEDKIETDVRKPCNLVKKARNYRIFRNNLEKNPAPVFSVKDIKREEISPELFKGSFILLHFWSMFSRPSVEELNDLKKIYGKYKNKNFVIISINIDKFVTLLDRKIYLNFIKEMDLNWHHIADGNKREIYNLYFVRNYPSCYLINPKGYIIYYEQELRGANLFSTFKKLKLTDKYTD